MREPLQNPPAGVLARAQLVRLPLRAEVIAGLQRSAARRGKPLGPLDLAHELGDVRFAAAFAPEPHGQIRPRWQAALSVFSLLNEPRPALIAHTVQDIDTLRSIPPPPSWPEDPILWNAAERSPLLARLERRRGLTVPFFAEFWPGYRVVDPSKPARGNRRTPGLREVDIAHHVQASRPDLERPAAYAHWLSTQLAGTRIDSSRVRLAGEVSSPAKPGSFQVIAIRLAGCLIVDDPTALGGALLRGVGRRRAYGLGLVVVR